MAATVKVEDLPASNLAGITPARSVLLVDTGAGWPKLNTIADLRTALLAGGGGFNSGDVLGVGSGGTGITTAPSNGQLLIGNGTDFTLSTITAGSGISVTAGAGSITIALAGGGPVTGSGTDNTLALWDGTSALEGSIVTQVSTAGLVVGGYLGVGTGTMPTSGSVRLPNESTIYSRSGSSSLFAMGFGTDGHGTGGSAHLWIGDTNGVGVEHVIFGRTVQVAWTHSSGAVSSQGIKAEASGVLNVNGWSVTGASNAGALVWAGAGGGGNSIGSDGVPVYSFYTARIRASSAASNQVIIYASGADQLVMLDGVLRGNADNDIDLGTTSQYFKDAYLYRALFKASTTSIAPLRLPHGSAPSSPTNGDIWTTTAGVFARVNGSTVGPFGAGGGSGIAAGTPGTIARYDSGGTDLEDSTIVETGGETQFASPIRALDGSQLDNYVEVWLDSDVGNSFVVYGKDSTFATTYGAVLLAIADTTDAWYTGTVAGDAILQSGAGTGGGALHIGTNQTGVPTITIPADGESVVLNFLLATAASATGGAGLNLPHGSAPTAPVDGDLWTTTSGLYVRINGSTVGPLAAGGGGGLADGSYGDITVSGSGTVLSISSGVIVNADVHASAAIAYSKLDLATSIVNADISASAGIVDTKLATIATAGKVSNSATTATNANTASAIVARDGSGNFSAGTITAALTGNASTATALQTARTINGTSFDGTGNITVAAAAGTLTGATLAAGVTASSLTSVGTLSSLTMGGTVALVDNLLTRPYLQDYAEVVNALGNQTGAFNVDYTSGNVATITLTGSATATITNPPATGRHAAITLYVTGNGSATFAITNGVLASDQSSPAAITNAKVRAYYCWSINAGTTWRYTYAGEW